MIETVVPAKMKFKTEVITCVLFLIESTVSPFFLSVLSYVITAFSFLYTNIIDFELDDYIPSSSRSKVSKFSIMPDKNDSDSHISVTMFDIGQIDRIL